ncbi:MAG: serine/threonine-protein kinase [Kofleriaceae bacterium]
MKGLAAVGDVLAGKYRVDKILGIGGMGMVVAATHLELDQRVALKFMLPGSIESSDSAARFLREARAAGRLNSDHVCRVMDVGRFETGVPYIVMEYLQGENLAALLRRRGPLRVSEAVDFILQGIEGLAEAHAHGIIHRDLKPDNLFLHKRNDGGSLVKVLDFGISKLSSGGHSTKTGDIMGSPAYMAPEQMESTRSVDHRADVWSLGVVLYQLVVGKAPFTGDTLPLLCLHVVNDAPKSMSAIRGDLPDGFEAVVMKCLEKEPGDRYGDVGLLAKALAPFGPKNATTSASRIQIVLTRSRKESVSSLSELSAASATMDHQGAVPPIRRERTTPLEATTLGATSGQSLGTLRTERGSKGLVIGVIAALGIAALIVGMVWPNEHGASHEPSKPPLEPVAAEPVRSAPIVEPILEDPPAKPPVVAPVPAVDVAPVPVATAPVASPVRVGDLGKKPGKPDGHKRPTRPVTPARPGARPGAGSAGSAAGSAAPDDDDEKWSHMTHDENKP